LTNYYEFFGSEISHYQQMISIFVLIRITIQIQEFLMEFLPLQDRDSCWNFVSNS